MGKHDHYGSVWAEKRDSEGIRVEFEANRGGTKEREERHQKVADSDEESGYNTKGSSFSSSAKQRDVTTVSSCHPTTAVYHKGIARYSDEPGPINLPRKYL